MRRTLRLLALATALPLSLASGITRCFNGTLGITEKRYRVERSVVLEDVRLGQHASYDRIVFEFARGAMPGYHIEYVDKPAYYCGSGEAVWLAGDGWLSISFRSTQAHDDQGKSTVDHRRQLVDLPIIKEVQNTCDFEGQVTWVLGVSSPTLYRMLELEHPTRLVVDVKH